MTYKNQEAELERLLAYVLESNASDLHLLVGKPPIVRIDSQLSPISDYQIYDAEEIEKLLAGLIEESEFRKRQMQEKKQVDFSYDFKGQARFRVNVYYQKGTLAAANSMPKSPRATISAGAGAVRRPHGSRQINDIGSAD